MSQSDQGRTGGRYRHQQHGMGDMENQNSPQPSSMLRYGPPLDQSDQDALKAPTQPMGHQPTSVDEKMGYGSPAQGASDYMQSQNQMEQWNPEGMTPTTPVSPTVTPTPYSGDQSASAAPQTVASTQPSAVQNTQASVPKSPAAPTTTASTPSGGGGGFASPFGMMNFSGKPAHPPSSSPSPMAHGGIATHPTAALVGEHNRPERIMKLGRYGGGMPGMRADGHNVPGNEPGGANGRFGGLSQHPGQEANNALSRAIERDAEGGVISSPTHVMLDPGEAVVPLDGHAGSKLTPGMMQPRRYRMTGPAITHHPIGTMPPAMLDKQMHNS